MLNVASRRDMVPDLPGGIPAGSLTVKNLSECIAAALKGREMYITALARELGIAKDRRFLQALDELEGNRRIERFGWRRQRVRLTRP